MRSTQNGTAPAAAAAPMKSGRRAFLALNARCPTSPPAMVPKRPPMPIAVCTRVATCVPKPRSRAK